MSRPLAELQQYQREFAQHLRAPRRHAPPSGLARRRLRVYAELVYHNMESTLAACFPVARQMLGARRWPRLVRRFVAAHRCATPLFRRIPEEFLHFLQSSAVAGLRLPGYLPSLAHYEWIELALAQAEVEEVALPQGDPLREVPVLAPALVLLSYPYAVQRIAPDCRPRRPASAPVQLLLFRDAAGVVRFVELNPLSLQLLQLLQDGQATGVRQLERLATLQPQLPREQVLHHGQALLGELQRLGAIAGTRPA